MDELRRVELLTVVYRQYFSLLWNYANSLAGNNLWSDDIVHSVFVKLSKNCETLDRISGDDNKVRAYLLRSVYHSFITIHGKEKNHLNIDDLFTLDSGYNLEHDVLSRQARSEFNNDLKNILTVKEWHLLSLYYYVGLTHKEIANEISSTAMSVKTQLYLIREKLKKQLSVGGDVFEI